MPQTITWTALPNGIAAAAAGKPARLRLSVRASPRLSPIGGEQRLDAFADFIDWAKKPWSFTVTFGAGGTALPPVTGLVPLNSPDPALWSRLFLGPPAVRVRDRIPGEYAHRVVRSFPASRVLDFIRQQYVSVAVASPTDLPAPERLWGRRGGIASVEEPQEQSDFADFKTIELIEPEALVKSLDAMIENGLVPYHYPGYIDARKAVELDFFQAQYFHRPKGGSYKTRPKPPDPDFHQVLALLGDYPVLLRALGLVFDLEVLLPPGLAGIAEPIVRAWPETALADAADSKIALATRFEHGPGWFAAKPAGALLTRGHLDLSGKDFSVAQVDIDGAAIKAVNFAQTVADLGIRKLPVLGTPRRAGLPALRSGGMSVLMNNRAADFLARLKAGHALEAKFADPALRDTIRLDAEDVIRGFRVDILDEQQGRWLSLCERRGFYAHADAPVDPLLTPEPVDEGTVTVPAVAGSDPGDTDLYLHEALFHWDGWSLAVPYPGKAIARPVKAGSGDTDDSGDAIAMATGLRIGFKPVAGSLPRLRFGRSYRIRARVVDIAGNSRRLDEDGDEAGQTAATPYLRFEPVPSPVVIADDGLRPGESPDRLVIRDWTAAPSQPETCRRHLLPPRAAIQLAELHGMLESPPPDGSTSWYDLLAERDAAAVPDRIAPGDTLDAVAYLPDPLAWGAALAGLPGADAPLSVPVSYDVGTAWPFLGTVRLRLEGGPQAGYRWEAAERAIVVTLPPAEQITLRLSSVFPDRAALETMGLWHWIRAAIPEAWAAKFAAIAAEGRHWMLTPFREITLVHAVQAPLDAPVLEGAASRREAGQTFHTLSGLLRLHGKSTDKVDIRAAWTDLSPAPDSESGVRATRCEADAAAFKVTAPDLTLATLGERHELGDTRHRRVSYWLTATSRFREYYESDFDPSLPAGLDFVTPAGSGRPADFILDVPSSARPPMPEIAYVIPTFDWDEEPGHDGTVRRRGGNSLRVYLSGDWYVSGDGELLGVVVAHGPQVVTGNGLNTGETAAVEGSAAPVPPDRLEPLVTRWGADPIWRTGWVEATPTLHHFPAATARASGLSLAEHPVLPAGEPRWGVAVAGHPVAYDVERRLWYCDIRIEAGASYFPFIRLALARFQPCSVSGTELSRIVVADCVQTAPDRLAWISPVANQPASLKVSVSGIAPRRSVQVACPNRVVVRAEARLPDRPDSSAPVWIPMTGPWCPLDEMQVSKTVTVWSGTITLPQVREAQRYRLVIEEYEFLLTDPGRGIDTGSGSGMRLMMSISRANVWPRLVYSDVIEVTTPTLAADG